MSDEADLFSELRSSTAATVGSQAVYTRSYNRESWLLEAVDHFRPDFDGLDRPLPELVRVSTGFPKGRRSAIGEYCLSPGANGERFHYVFVSPVIEDSVEALAVLLHELCHAACPPGEGHGREFGRLARSLGLAGRLTATVAGPELKLRLRNLVPMLGCYPHRKLEPGSFTGQSTRMLKLTCPCCGYLVRTTNKWLNRGLPRCPAGTEMLPA